jgi:RNA polymerase sigma-32 factor
MKLDATGINKPLNLGVTVNLSSIDNYHSTAMRFPMLTPPQEDALWVRVRNNDQKAIDALAHSYMRLVMSQARQLKFYGMSQDDLVQEGSIGMMKAIHRFDPAQNVRFATYAIPWIKAEMMDYVIRNSRIVKSFTTKAHRKLFFNLRSRLEVGRSMTEEQIKWAADALEVRPEDVREVEMRMRGGDSSIDVPPTNQFLDSADMDDFVYHYLSDDTLEPTNVLSSMRMVELQTTGLQKYMEKLNEREQYIIEQRFLVNDEGAGVPLRAMADKYNISCERVRQIEVAALKKLRTHMADDYSHMN